MARPRGSGLMSPTRRRALRSHCRFSRTNPQRASPRGYVSARRKHELGQSSTAVRAASPAAFNNRSLRASSFRGRLFAEVTRFDIVTIEVEYECGVVIVAVLAPKPRWPIILRAGFECLGMELMHRVFA